MTRMPSLAAEERADDRPLLPLVATAGAPLPPHVREAVLAALDEAIGRLVGADAEREVLVTNGALHALSIAFRALLSPGDSVLVPTPAFFFGGLIEQAGARPVYVEAPRLEPDRLERAIDATTRALVLCNPVNPTGYPAGRGRGRGARRPGGATRPPARDGRGLRRYDTGRRRQCSPRCGHSVRRGRGRSERPATRGSRSVVTRPRSRASARR
jgi:hypothetical protein